MKVTESSDSFVKATVSAVTAASGRRSACCMRLPHCVLIDPHPKPSSWTLNTSSLTSFTDTVFMTRLHLDFQMWTCCTATFHFQNNHINVKLACCFSGCFSLLWLCFRFFFSFLFLHVYDGYLMYVRLWYGLFSSLVVFIQHVHSLSLSPQWSRWPTRPAGTSPAPRRGNEFPEKSSEGWTRLPHTPPALPSTSGDT